MPDFLRRMPTTTSVEGASPFVLACHIEFHSALAKLSCPDHRFVELPRIWGSMGSACGSSRVTSKSNTLWDGHSIRSGATKRSDGIGNWCAMPSPSVGFMPLTPLQARRNRHWSLLIRQMFRLPTLLSRREQRKKSSGETRVRPLISWPVALRAVCGWLEPYIMLRRYWKGWSPLPPPPELQFLLRRLEQGHAISLYSSA